jgi:hypothetical protein
LDAGQFEILSGDRVVGTETFAIRRQGDEYMAVGRLTIEGGPDALRSVELGLRADADFLPRRYELRSLEGRPTNLAVGRSGRRLRLTNSTEEGERLTEFLAGPEMVLLERGVAHHYFFLVQRLARHRDPAGATLSALVPAEGRQVSVRVRGVAQDDLQIGGRTVSARRYDLEVAQEPVSVWVDGDAGRVLRVAVSTRGWSATRVPKE